MPIIHSILETIGKTPLIELHKMQQYAGVSSRILAKLEYLNPAGSIKDRVALAMVEDAEKSGRIQSDTTLIEPTSGNTGIGLAMVAASKGYRAIIVMPDTMSVERRRFMSAYGAELVLTDGTKGMAGAIEQADKLAKEIGNAVVMGQFSNPSNPAIHEKTTGPEIWQDCDGNIDILVCGIGTGGTISGVGRFLKSQNPDIKVIGVEPASSPVITEGRAGSHRIEGIGANFVPDNLDLSVVDKVITIKNDEAFEYGAKVAKAEGFLVGISSGAAVCAALKVAKDLQNKGKTIVVILPDGGDRYLSTEMYA